MLRIDIDKFKQYPVIELMKLMFSIPFPWKVRISASGNGLHIKSVQLDKFDFRREMYDDPMRCILDDRRCVLGLPDDNLLWDVKMGRFAQEWQTMHDQTDILDFFESYLTEKLK